MTVITFQQAQDGLAEYLDRVAQGETIVITRDDQPVAELRPPEPPPQPARTPRPIGLARGLGTVPPSFFEPLPDDLLAAFEGRGE